MRDNSSTIGFDHDVTERGLFKRGVSDANWYADLNGYLLDDDEDSAWLFLPTGTEGDPTPAIVLPFANLGKGMQTSLNDANVYVRATSDLLPPLPGSLYAKGEISTLGNVLFECCDRADCPGNGAFCISNVCVEDVANDGGAP